ncbi:MAG: hypothetical protein LCH79_15385 [Proteobacteria bacterium]|nr:hypothetical protein [Pseudomonadota bacterium]
MKSTLINQPEAQLTLVFEGGLSEKYQSLRECIAAGVYRQGLGNIAIDLNKAPGNLSVELSDDPTRKFSVDSLEKYIEKTGDTAPIHYLIDKFLNEKSRKQEAAMAQLAPILQQLAPLLRQAGSLPDYQHDHHPTPHHAARHLRPSPDCPRVHQCPARRPEPECLRQPPE